MKTHGNIESYDSYEICKKFHLHVKTVTNYLVKRIGVDTHERRSTLGIRRGKRLPHYVRRLARMLHELRRNKKSNLTSKRIYHEPEPV